MRKTLGLALGSGGVRGFAHIGVLKALLRHDIPIDYIAGTSIGAWVGALYALHQDIDELEEFTVGKKQEKLAVFLEPSLEGGFVHGMKLEALLTYWLKDALFEDLQIPLQIVATDLIRKEPCVFSSGRIVPALHASMAIPGLFRPVPFEDKILVDGGVCNPVPCDIVRNMGADIVLAVNLNNERTDTVPRPLRRNLGFIEVAARSMATMRLHLAELSVAEADIVIEPNLSSFGSITKYFAKETSLEAMEIGEREAEKIIPELLRLLS